MVPLLIQICVLLGGLQSGRPFPWGSPQQLLAQRLQQRKFLFAEAPAEVSDGLNWPGLGHPFIPEPQHGMCFWLGWRWHWLHLLSSGLGVGKECFPGGKLGARDQLNGDRVLLHHRVRD